MSLFGQTKRHVPAAKNARRSPLPVFAGVDHEKKYDLSAPFSPNTSRFFTTVYLPLPSFFSRSSTSDHLPNGNGYSPRGYGSRTHQRRYARVCVPIPPRVYARLPRLNSPLRILLGFLLALGFVFVLLGFRQRGPRGNSWTPPFTDPDTLVLAPEEVAMIWEWEILSGHYPNVQSPPENIPVAATIQNPAVPKSLLPSIASPPPIVAYNQKSSNTPRSQFIGIGPERTMIDVASFIDHHPGFPSRPMPGAIIDLDVVLEKCDFSNNKYVRDCLEFLRIGGGLDNGKRVRRGNYLGQYKQLYYENTMASRQLEWTPRKPVVRRAELSRSALTLPAPLAVASTYDSKDPCDPAHPRIFHMFWAGDFTDKPYMAVMSFLFTQNLGLDSAIETSSNNVRNTCRPQFWVWINPGPAAAVPNPNAQSQMYDALKKNAWSAPFLDDKFSDVVKFKMWNTTEQLDGVDELKDHWRNMQIFNSGGHKYAQAPAQPPVAAEPVDENAKLGDVLEEEGQAEKEAAAEPAQAKKKKDPLFEKVGSTSENEYDRLSVILSDMARFVLTYRYGGIYLDADTIFMRDWEELWNYRGHFAYRWSWHKKYNTAVLKSHKNSALGKFLFKTALENDLDFHPMTVTRYLKDAGLENMLFRVPDALFDPAWLNMEGYQRERPPFPYFVDFSKFFSNHESDTAAAQPAGFDGFFRGAFSYHFHNFWWKPFDPSRNFPDLGQRFIQGERALREANAKVQVGADDSSKDTGVTSRADMDDEVDLSWSTVLKRTFEGYVRGERPNMYGEWLEWESR